MRFFMSGYVFPGTYAWTSFTSRFSSGQEFAQCCFSTSSSAYK